MNSMTNNQIIVLSCIIAALILCAILLICHTTMEVRYNHDIKRRSRTNLNKIAEVLYRYTSFIDMHKCGELDDPDTMALFFVDPAKYRYDVFYAGSDYPDDTVMEVWHIARNNYYQTNRHMESKDEYEQHLIDNGYYYEDLATWKFN